MAHNLGNWSFDGDGVVAASVWVSMGAESMGLGGHAYIVLLGASRGL